MARTAYDKAFSNNFSSLGQNLLTGYCSAQMAKRLILVFL
jgi:hypothetical protein